MWMLGVILHSLYYISPAYCANALAVFGGGKPVDFGRKWRGKRVFGDGKTWRGLIIGVVAGTLFGLMWFYLSKSGPLNETYYNVFDFRITDPLFGLYLSIGAMFGDLVKSFFKRRLGIPPGKPWFPFDQIDYTLGALAFASIIYLPDWWVWLIIIGSGIIFHVLINYLGFLLKVKETKF